MRLFLSGRSRSIILEQSGFLSLPVTFLLSFPFVVCLLTGSDTNEQFCDAAFIEVEF